MIPTLALISSPSRKDCLSLSVAAEIVSTKRVTGSVAVAAIDAITLALIPEVTPVISVPTPVLKDNPVELAATPAVYCVASTVLPR